MTSPASRRPRVGLVVKELKGFGGLEISSLRHVRLLTEEIDIIPISLEESKEPRDWRGRVERTECHGQNAYRVTAADFKIDKLFGMTELSKHSYVDHLVRIAAEESLTALHVYGAFEMRPFIGAVAAARADLPLVISFRGADLDLRIFGGNFAHLQAAVQVAGVCVCVNETARRVLRRVLNPRSNVHVIHNHVEPGDFDDGPPPALNQPGPLVGCVGEFRRVTGLDYLLQAFNELAPESGASLLLVGPLRPMEAIYYSRMIDDHQYSPRVLRVGSVEHSRVLSYMRACDVLAFPSVSDGCPNKVLEAMLAGRAIVASDVGGIPELIRDGVDGVLVPPRDGSRLASAIAELLNDPARRCSLGESARERALSQFTPEREREAWLRCYREVGAC